MLTVGIDIGGTSIRAGVVNPTGRVVDLATTPTPRTEAELDAAVVRVVRELGERHPVSAVGLAVAGFISEDRRLVRFSPHLPWQGAAVGDRLSVALGTPVVLEHDVNAAALAEYRFGSARDRGVVAMVAVGTGIGAALLVDGRLYRGAHGVAPELGHLSLVPGGRPCPCGKTGCWERYCSGTALVDTVVELATDRSWPGSGLAAELAAGRELTGEGVAEAAVAGDPLGAAGLDEFAGWLGRGLALVSDVLDPELIVLGGGVAASSELYLASAVDHYTRAATGTGHRPLASVGVSALGGRGGIVGAAELARDDLVGRESTLRATPTR
ncbi:glucokinase [Actinoalloteichus sp. AHMU CJ021]|uniref:ROK family protein n=1 Tax=Actinoalloteichus sp. AHMU CJ021 TaxID=2072503 RepID=UPI000CA055DD|nr:glucokinase [Actinoalloteichus sp. AHMU CJ021]